MKKAFLIAVLGAVSWHVIVDAQIVGRNVNVVGGIKDQFIGDMFRQRQNESTVCTFSTNPNHRIVAYNDYRTVDIARDTQVGTPSPIQKFVRWVPFLRPFFQPPAKKPWRASANAWIGLSYTDNGVEWYTGLHPGSEFSPLGLGTDLGDTQRGTPAFEALQFTAASDPVFAATPAHCLMVGIAFDNIQGESAGFVSRFTDLNNSETGSNTRFDFTKVVVTSDAKHFVDKPSIAASADGKVFAAFVLFDESDPKKLSSKIVFFRSSNFGETWSQTPIVLSDPLTRNQAPWILVDPNDSNTVYVGWRVFSSQSGGWTNAIVGKRSKDGGQTFEPSRYPYPVAIALSAYDQPMTNYPEFAPIPRSAAYPTAAIDSHGAIHVALQEYVNPADGYPLSPSTPTSSGIARIVVTSSYDGGLRWTRRRAIDYGPQSGPQFMPALSVAGVPGPTCSGKTGPRSVVTLAYYDARAGYPGGSVFFGGGDKQFDVRVAQADPCVTDSGRLRFAASQQVSRYSRTAEPPHSIFTAPGPAGHGHPAVNKPYRMFNSAQSAFTGDYIGLSPRVPYVLTPSGFWKATTARDVDPALLPAPVFDVAFPDTRDVSLPTSLDPGVLPSDPSYIDRLGWETYQPPHTGNVPTGTCENPGSRDQNVYTATLSSGLTASAPVTFKFSNVPRDYPLVVQNWTSQTVYARLTIATANAQFNTPRPGEFVPPERVAYVALGSFSSVTGSVVVLSGVEDPVLVTIQQTDIDGNDVANALRTSVTIITAPNSNAGQTERREASVDPAPIVTKPFGSEFPKVIQDTQDPLVETPFGKSFEQNPFGKSPFGKSPFGKSTDPEDDPTVSNSTFYVSPESGPAQSAGLVSPAVPAPNPAERASSQTARTAGAELVLAGYPRTAHSVRPRGRSDARAPGSRTGAALTAVAAAQAVPPVAFRGEPQPDQVFYTIRSYQMKPSCGAGPDTEACLSPAETVDPGKLDVAVISQRPSLVVKDGVAQFEAVQNESRSNAAPVAIDDLFIVNEEEILNLDASEDLLGNDTDADGDSLSITAVGNATNGTVSEYFGQITFEPAANFFGVAGFDYTVTDGENTDVAHVTVTVRPVNDAPVPGPDSGTTAEDTPITFTVASLLANDSAGPPNENGQSLSVPRILTSDSTNGLVAYPDGLNIIYTPAANYSGPASFRYQLCDDGSTGGEPDPKCTDLEGTPHGVINVTVTPVNDPPVAANDSYSVAEGSVLTVPAPGVLGNDSDIDSSPITAILAGGPSNGTLTLNDNGSFTYTPAGGFVGTVTFTYRASDGTSQSNVATVTITVVPTTGDGVVTDPAGDVAAGAPDLTRATVLFVNGDALLSVRFRPGTFDVNTTLVQFVFDTDQNPATGSPGVDSGCQNDRATMGTDRFVEFGVPSYHGTRASVSRAAGTTCNQYVFVQNVNGAVVNYPDGIDVRIPQSLVDDDGRVNFKVVTATLVNQGPPAGFTGIQDYMPDVGLAPGVVSGTVVTLAPSGSGSLVPGQSFNETRGLNVTVLGPNPVTVIAMTLRDINVIAEGSASAIIRAKIYDAGELIASGQVTIGSGFGQEVTVPIPATTLDPGRNSYRVAFFVQSTPSGAGSGTMWDPAPEGAGGFPYAESTGRVNILQAYSAAGDVYPTNVNIFAPQIRLTIR